METQPIRFDRNTAQFELTTALVAGDSLTAGTQNTKGTVLPYSRRLNTLPSEGYIWIAIDDPVIPISTGAYFGLAL